MTIGLQDDCPDLRIFGELGHNAIDLFDHLRVDGVKDFRSVQCYDADVTVHMGFDGFERQVEILRVCCCSGVWCHKSGGSYYFPLRVLYRSLVEYVSNLVFNFHE